MAAPALRLPFVAIGDVFSPWHLLGERAPGLMSKALRLQGAPDSVIALVNLWLKCSKQSDQCFVAEETAAQKLGWTHDKVQHAARWLREHGVYVPKRRGRQIGGHGVRSSIKHFRWFKELDALCFGPGFIRKTASEPACGSACENACENPATVIYKQLESNGVIAFRRPSYIEKELLRTDYEHIHTTPSTGNSSVDKQNCEIADGELSSEENQILKLLESLGFNSRKALRLVKTESLAELRVGVEETRREKIAKEGTRYPIRNEPGVLIDGLKGERWKDEVKRRKYSHSSSFRQSQPEKPPEPPPPNPSPQEFLDRVNNAKCKVCLDVEGGCEHCKPPDCDRCEDTGWVNKRFCDCAVGEEIAIRWADKEWKSWSNGAWQNPWKNKRQDKPETKVVADECNLAPPVFSPSGPPAVTLPATPTSVGGFKRAGSILGQLSLSEHLRKLGFDPDIVEAYADPPPPPEEESRIIDFERACEVLRGRNQNPDAFLEWIWEFGKRKPSWPITQTEFNQLTTLFLRALSEKGGK